MTRNYIPQRIDVDFIQRLAKVLFFISPLLVMQAFQVAKGKADVILDSSPITQTAFYLFCIYSIIIFGNFDGASFIYFQF